jgi:hypothetical protein
MNMVFCGFHYPTVQRDVRFAARALLERISDGAVKDERLAQPTEEAGPCAS